MQWNKVTLIGVGLLGGSLGLALRTRHLARQVAGYVRREASVSESEQSGAVDIATTDLQAAVEGADLVVFCTPLGQMRSLALRAASHMKPGVIVTDVGSVKRTVVDELSEPCEQAGAHFIGSHPMAGSDKTGVAFARTDLFDGAVCAVTPGAATPPAVVSRVESLWRSVGCRILVLSPDEHDELVSRSSHLPHVLAATLASFVLDPSASSAQAMLCANGFRDTTRIASGSPEMWRDIAIANAEHLCNSIDEFTRRLTIFSQAVRRGELAAIAKTFEEAKERRDSWASRPAASSPE